MVHLREFCIFKNVEEDNYYLGNILSLASIEENSVRRKVVWDWDGLDNKIAALCNWWEFERLKDGKLIDGETERVSILHSRFLFL